MCSSAWDVFKKQASDTESIMQTCRSGKGSDKDGLRRGCDDDGDATQVILDNLFRFHFIVSHFSIYEE